MIFQATSCTSKSKISILKLDSKGGIFKLSKNITSYVYSSQLLSKFSLPIFAESLLYPFPPARRLIPSDWGTEFVRKPGLEMFMHLKKRQKKKKDLVWDQQQQLKTKNTTLTTTISKKKQKNNNNNKISTDPILLNLKIRILDLFKAQRSILIDTTQLNHNIT